MDSSEVQRALDSSEELQITVAGRKTGKQHSTPVWFVREGKIVFLLPVRGSKNEWYKNVQKSKKMMISSGNVSLDLPVKPLTESKKVAYVVEKFRKKHGTGDVQKYYSVFDVAVELNLP